MPPDFVIPTIGEMQEYFKCKNFLELIVLWIKGETPKEWSNKIEANATWHGILAATNLMLYEQRKASRQITEADVLGDLF